MNIHDEFGWLVDADTENTVDITESDLEALLQLADSDDNWVESIKNEMCYHDKHPSGTGIDILRNYIRTMNAGGTIVQYPFGYVCTFPSRRHLFRGERQDYPHSEASLMRRCRNKDGKKRSEKEIEILHVISNMRIVQFRKFIWQFDIVPQWEGKLSEVNYKALAQHYGFETFLLDLTNDVRDALFFATCKWDGNQFRPLTQEDIDESERSKYGVLYHSPDWALDFMNGDSWMRLHGSFEKEKNRTSPSIIDTGLWDGVAYQIGLQPFYRAHAQYGYVYPMKTLDDIRHSGKFERLRFRQTVEFSNRMYDMMNGGNRVYPDEGINAVEDTLKEMQKTLVFSEDDLLWAYELDEANREMFPDIESLRKCLESEETKCLLHDCYHLDGKVEIQQDEVLYPISNDMKEYINNRYNNKSFLEPVGNLFHDTCESRKYRRERYFQIFDEYPET